MKCIIKLHGSTVTVRPQDKVGNTQVVVCHWLLLVRCWFGIASQGLPLCIRALSAKTLRASFGGHFSVAQYGVRCESCCVDSCGSTCEIDV